MLRSTFVSLSLCLLFSGPALFAQGSEPVPEPGTGLIFDLPSYRGTPYKAQLTAASYADIPTRASLEQYCPTPGDQGKYGTCVAFAVAYHMRTVLYGREHGITDKAQLNASVFSPTFIYEQIKEAGDATCQGSPPAAGPWYATVAPSEAGNGSGRTHLYASACSDRGSTVRK